MVIRRYSFFQAVCFGIGSGLGWWLAISILAAIRHKIKGNKLPAGVTEPAIAFITTGIIALAFLGFSGIFIIQ